MAFLVTTADGHCQNCNNCNLNEESRRLQKVVIIGYLKIFSRYLLSKNETKTELYKINHPKWEFKTTTSLGELDTNLLRQQNLTAELFHSPD